MLTGPVTETGNTPIEVAVCEGKLDVIKYLVHQRSVDIKGILKLVAKPQTVESMAKAYTIICTYKLATGPVTRNGETLLGLAVREGKLEIIKYLVTMQSVDVNGKL